MYLNGLEAGDFVNREVQDRQEYSNSTGYLDVMDKAADLEIQSMFSIRSCITTPNTEHRQTT